ncbi:MAG: hypothetical protein AB7S77_07170 [Desulfatirhabdiaceae bacterium]
MKRPDESIFLHPVNPAILADIFLCIICHNSISLQRVREREINGLLMGARITSSTKGIILTMDQEERLERDGVQVAVIPAWKFFALEKLNPPENTLAYNRTWPECHLADCQIVRESQTAATP